MTWSVVILQHIPREQSTAGIISCHNPGRDETFLPNQPYSICADWIDRNHLSYLHRRAINV